MTRAKKNMRGSFVFDCFDWKIGENFWEMCANVKFCDILPDAITGFWFILKYFPTIRIQCFQNQKEIGYDVSQAG